MRRYLQSGVIPNIATLRAAASRPYSWTESEIHTIMYFVKNNT
jgi:hypothetical protein